MDPVSSLSLAAIIILTLLSAVLATAENAALELSRTALDLHPPRSERAERQLAALLDNRFRFWVSARLGATLAIFTAATLAATSLGDALMEVIPSRAGSVAVAIASLAVLHAVLARIVPRILAQRYASVLARRLAVFAWAQYVVFLPVTMLLERLLSPADHEAWKGPDPEDAAVLEAVEEGTRVGSIDETDSAMIANVIELGDRVARQVMTPRPDVVATPIDTPVRDALALARLHGLSRLPVYTDNLDHVVGILHVRDGMGALLDETGPTDLRAFLRAAFYVPESMRVDLLLRELQAKKTHLAVVINEYGETSGLVTIEDLLEEIVGEIEDEFDAPEIPIQEAADGEAVVDANVLIADLNEALDLSLVGEDVDTLGGLVYNAFGRVPDEGETIAVDGAALEVLETLENRIIRVKVRKAPSSAADGG